MLRKSKNLILFIVIIFIAGALRFKGIYHSFPPYHSDEGMSYAQGITMVREKSLDVNGYSLSLAYPNVVPLVNAALFKTVFIPAKWVGYIIENFGQIVDGYIKFPLEEELYKRVFQVDILGEREINVLRWGRMIAATIGLGNVIVGYVLAKEMFDEKTGIVAALLIGVNYRQVLNSHIGLPDIYNSFFLMLALLFAYRLWKRGGMKDYILAGVFAALSFSVKFHVYSFVAVGVGHLMRIIEHKGGIKERIIEAFWDRKVWVAALACVLVVVLINPHHFMRMGEVSRLLTDVSKKYRVGRMKIDLYSFWYLYHFGIGRTTIVLVLVGMLASLWRKTKTSLLLLAVVGAFFFVVSYYTGGGFYTRNFVTITPVLLMLGAYTLSSMLDIKLGGVKRVAVLVLAVVLLGMSLQENLVKSLVVAKEYSERWNGLILSDWVSGNIPKGARVAAHSSVVLPVEGVERIAYNFDNEDFSTHEFRRAGAEYIITNTDWAAGSFYWWMTKDPDDFEGKPMEKLESSFAALALKENFDFSVYGVTNSGLAPDSNFVVSVVPRYEVISKQLVESGEKYEVGQWEGYVVEGRYRSSKAYDAYVYLLFYDSEQDIGSFGASGAVRLSGRNVNVGEWEDFEIVGEIPEGMKYMVVGSGSYVAASDAEVDEIKVYNAEVNMETGGWEVEKFEIDKGALFPNSHGNL